jgi:hypothetical protein
MKRQRTEKKGLSSIRSAIQLAESESDRALHEWCRARRERALQIIAEETLETKRQAGLLEAQIMADPDTTTPQELDEDDDL